MKRSQPLKRTALKRGKPMKRKGGKPKRFAKLRNPDYLAWIRTLPCTVGHKVAYPPLWRCAWIGDRLAIEAAHLKTRGSGGADLGNVVPLCPWHHMEQEGYTKRFNEMYNVDLRAIAETLALQWKATR